MRPPTAELPPRRAPRVLTWAAVGLAVVTIVASMGLRVAESAARDRIAGIGARYGLSVEVGDLDIPWFGGITLRGVTIDGEGPNGPVRLATFPRIETDLDLMSAIGGARRPKKARIIGGEVRAFLNDRGLVGGPRRSPTEADDSSEGGGAGALEVELEGLTVHIAAELESASAVAAARALLAGMGGAADGTRRPALVLPEVVAGGVTGMLGRDAGGGISGALRGEVAQGHGEVGTPFDVTLDPTTGLSLTLGAGERGAVARLRVEAPGGPLFVGARGAKLSWTEVGVEDLFVGAGETALVVDALSLTRSESAGRVEARGVAARRGEVALRVSSAELGLKTEPGEVPEPVKLGLGDVLVVSRAGTRGPAARLAISRVSVGFDEVLTHATRGDPLAGITSVLVEGPEGTVAIPAALLARAAGSRPPSEEETAPIGADGMPIMPNDDPSLLATAAADGAGAKASARERGLDRLFEALERRLAGVDALTGGSVGAMARTAARLKPEIRGARVAFVDETGAALAVLDEGAFGLAPRADGGLEMSFESRVVRGGEEEGRFAVQAEVGADGLLGGARVRLRGRGIAGRLAALVDHFDVQSSSEMDLDLTWTRPTQADAPHHVKGRLQFKHFTFSYWRISDRPIDDLEGVVDFDVSIDVPGRRLLVDLPTIRVRDGRLAASVDVRKPAGARPSFRFKVRMPRQDCGAAAASIPRSLIPNLRTLRLSGTAQFEASLDVDLEKPRELSLRVDGDLERCQVLSLSPDIVPERLRGRFIHHPREPERGVLTHIAVGRGTREWIPSEDIPPLVKLAAWVTEDRKWEDHGGVRWDLVASALKIDLDHGRFVYGGSTITQQLVKNLYLSRTKNLARKFEEAIIAWQMERVLEKDEILTTYINCIEYGPDIYGIRAAARHYFDKAPQDLDALEAAFIMGLKPYPKAGQRQFERGVLDKWWIRRVSYVLRLMAKYGPELITLEEAEAFDPFQPDFRRP